VHELGQVGREEEEVDRARRDDPERRSPVVPDDVEEEQGGDRDRAGDGHAEGEGERG
jgi:hypothetical protein